MVKVQSHIEKIKSYEGKKRYLFSFIFGCLVGLALSPTYITAAAIIGFAAHLHQIDACFKKKQAFWL
jgi:apolipoprotein N-acyltransferase